LIEIIAETGSTNADLAARLAAGEVLDERRWLVANRQVSGRGRQGRPWSDGAGNFMGSTAVPLHAGGLPAHTLSMVAAVAVHIAVLQVAPRIVGLTLKWPNDLLLDGAKLAGILLERRGDTVIVGIGVNLAQAPEVPERAVASLAEAGYMVRRDDFAAALDGTWADALGLWRAGAWDQLRADWIARAHPFGTALKVHGPAGEMLAGTFAGLDPDGALQLRLANGTKRTIHAGEVDLDTRR